MTRARRIRVELLALGVVAIVASTTGSLPLLSLVGAFIPVVKARTRMERRSAEAAVLGWAAALAYLALGTAVHLDARLAYLAPCAAGAVTIVLKSRLSRGAGARRLPPP